MSQAHTKVVVGSIVLVIAVLLSFVVGFMTGWLGKSSETSQWTQSGQIEAAFGVAQSAALEACEKNTAQQLDCKTVKTTSVSDISSAELSPDNSLRYSFNYDILVKSGESSTNVTVVASGSGKVLEVLAEWLPKNQN